MGTWRPGLTNIRDIDGIILEEEAQISNASWLEIIIIIII